MSDLTHEVSEELDFDEWLRSGARTTRHVNLFARMDLIAEIDELDKQRVTPEQYKTDEASLGGGQDINPNAEIDAKIEALEAEIWKSKRAFRVTALTDEENREIKRSVLEDFKDEIDKAAAQGRAEAIRTVKRMEITAPSEVNQVVRTGAKKYAEDLINYETGARVIAATTTTRNASGQWVKLDEETVKKIERLLGEGQINLLIEAANSARLEVPEISPSK